MSHSVIPSVDESLRCRIIVWPMPVSQCMNVSNFHCCDGYRYGCRYHYYRQIHIQLLLLQIAGGLGTWGLGPGTWDLGLGPGTWDRDLGPGTWHLGPRTRGPGTGTWDLGPGTWDWDWDRDLGPGTGTRDLVLGAWCLVPGVGAWCLVPGAWCLVLKYGPNFDQTGH